MKRPTLALAAVLLAACAAPTDDARPSHAGIDGPSVPAMPAQPRGQRASRHHARPKIVRPVPSATATHPPRPAHTSSGRSAATRAGHPWWQPSPWTQAMARCIRAHESGGRYDAVSGSDTYTGAYQFSDATWHYASKLGGRARDWPAAVQDRAFLRLFDNGIGAHQWPHTYPVCRAIYGGPA